MKSKKSQESGEEASSSTASKKRRRSTGHSEQESSEGPPLKRAKRNVETESSIKSRADSGESSVEGSVSQSTTPRQRSDVTRIFTDEEHEKIRMLRAKNEEKELSKAKLKNQQKRKAEVMEMLGDHDIDEAAIVGIRKKQRQSYQDRVQTLLESKQGNEEEKAHRGKYRRDRKQHSTTNEEKSKTKKSFNMTKHRQMTQRKARLSQKQKKLRLGKHVKKLKSQSMKRNF